MGGGFGRPSKLALSFGLQAENVGVSSWPNFMKSLDGYAANNAQAVYYLALASQGYQLSAGGMAEMGFTGLDAQGRFSPSATPYTYRPGAPPNLAQTQAGVGKRQSSTSFFASLTHREGVVLGGTFAKVREQLGDDATTRLAALRGQLRPERWVREKLEELRGIPSIGVDFFARGVDPYADRYAALRRRAEALAAGVPPSDAPSPGAIVQLPLAFEDILGSGAYARVVPQAAPKATLRMVDVGCGRSFGDEDVAFGFGVRGTAFQRSEAWTGSAEAMVGLTTRLVSARVAYAFNVPDAAVLLPIPNAHVIGFQLVYGRAEVALPITPIAATVAQLAPERSRRGGDEP